MYSDKLVYFDQEEKGRALSSAHIDEGVRELCDAINSIPYFMTMNSCEGNIFGDESHCPKTYVDFCVLEGKYEIAEDLMILLSSELIDELKAYEVDLSVKFEQDMLGKFNDSNEIEYYYSNLVRKRYSITFCDTRYIGSDKDHVLEAIRYSIRERIEKATKLIEDYKGVVLKGIDKA